MLSLIHYRLMIRRHLKDSKSMQQLHIHDDDSHALVVVNNVVDV
jgi:hypothetical protein